MAKSPLLAHFEYDNVVGSAKAHCHDIAALAKNFERNIPDGDEKDIVLRRLLDVKDAVIRACKL